MAARDMVLIVDDDQPIRRLLSIIVSGEGYEVLEAHDGLAALELLQSPGALPGLLLLDASMPRMDGQALLVALSQNARLRQIPVILMSASGIVRIHEAPQVVYRLAKPFLMQDLREAIIDALRCGELLQAS